MTNKIKALKYLLKSRLPDIDRWNKVDVVGPNDLKNIEKNEYIKQTFNNDGEHICICWHDSMTNTNHHPFEIREVKMEGIDDLIERSAIRLKNKSKPYR